MGRDTGNRAYNSTEVYLYIYIEYILAIYRVNMNVYELYIYTYRLSRREASTGLKSCPDRRALI